jgi:triosephosphate isomerase
MLIAGNWKMNTDAGEARALAEGVVRAVGDAGSVGVAVCPPATSLAVVHPVLDGSAVRLGAQNMHQADSGAYTGEVSASMLRSVGCRYVIIGHSERRQYFGETDESVNAKVRQALANGLEPIICVGETLEERDAGRQNEVVGRQVVAALEGVASGDAARLVVAYEPVWAIGTGRTASPDQAEAMHGHIRDLLRGVFGGSGDGIEILYGGSMKPANAVELLARQNVDGGLIGGASLKPDDFAAIVAAAKQVIGN